MNRPFPLSPGRYRGFSLVEIMVGMLISMIGIIVMLQVFALAEAQKRTTTSGNDAETGGAIALYGVQRDIRQGGYGIANFSMLGCNLALPAEPPPPAVATRPALTLNNMAPVTINHPSLVSANPDANTDTLLVVYGNSNGSPQGDGFAAHPSSTTYTVNTPTAFAALDRVIAMPRTTLSPCNLTLDTVAAGAAVTVNIGFAPAGGMPNGTLFNLGQYPKVIAYAIKGGNLTMCDYMVNDCSQDNTNANPSRWVSIANNIVSMRAQYGRDTTATNMDAIVDVYDQTTPASACTWVRVQAVRLVLVARNSQLEKTAVTAAAAAPTWAGSVENPPASGSAITSIDLSGIANWQNYRYKVFQTVVPIRNIVWMGKVSGC